MSDQDLDALENALARIVGRYFWKGLIAIAFACISFGGWMTKQQMDLSRSLALHEERKQDEEKRYAVTVTWRAEKDKHDARQDSRIAVLAAVIGNKAKGEDTE